MTYDDAVRQLYALGNELRPGKFDLARIRALLENIGNPHRRGRFVHVAGTNGKGSTCAMIESGLRHAGFCTGLYTSPHLQEPTERIRINGEPVSRERFAAAFARMPDRPTYFETVTAMAFSIFAEEVDITVLEVGLGGRLDATNVVTPELCIITPIDYDHQAWLGHDIASIAAEKAGILKPGVPAIFAPQRPDVLEILRSYARGIPLPEAAAIESGRYGSRFLLDETIIECPLPGEHQIDNARVAVTALRQLGVPDRAIQEGIASARWPGRLERLQSAPEIILDGAHNPAAARALASYIDRFYPNERLSVIFGVMRDKAIGEIASILLPRFDKVVLATIRQARALPPEDLLPMIHHPHVSIAPSLEEALSAITGPAFITGSLFLVAEARALLTNNVD